MARGFVEEWTGYDEEIAQISESLQ